MGMLSSVLRIVIKPIMARLNDSRVEVYLNDSEDLSKLMQSEARPSSHPTMEDFDRSVPEVSSRNRKTREHLAGMVALTIFCSSELDFLVKTTPSDWQ